MPARDVRLLIIIGISLISGVGDSQGFIHAARMWQGGKLVTNEFVKSALGFGVGISTYWLAVEYLQDFGVIAPETQTLIWFGVTIVGVAFVSGKFVRWQTTDQLVAVIVLLGIGWLLVRTGS